MGKWQASRDSNPDTLRMDTECSPNEPIFPISYVGVHDRLRFFSVPPSLVMDIVPKDNPRLLS